MHEHPSDLTAGTLLAGYAQGIFPMAESRDGAHLHWVNPRLRGIFPLDGFRISRSLRRRIGREDYVIRINTAFSRVVALCGDRDETWINRPLERLYDELHNLGHAESLEVWQDGELVGGVFGVTLAGAFFGESMFSRRTDMSKIAFVHAVRDLREAGTTLFDVQFKKRLYAFRCTVSVQCLMIIQSPLGHRVDQA